jgi:hypothetical protein
MRLLRIGFLFYFIGGALLLEFSLRRSFRLWQAARALHRADQPIPAQLIRRRKRMRGLVFIALFMVVSAILLLMTLY